MDDDGQGWWFDALMLKGEVVDDASPQRKVVM